MNCPTCKYPNPAGSAYCGMCYEVLGRSAAQTYLHAVKRERRMREQNESPSSSSSVDLEPFFDRLGALFRLVDWGALARTISVHVRQSRQGLLLAAGTLAAFTAVLLFHSPLMKFHIFGSRLAYEFSTKAPATYLVGLQTDLKSWSEREGRLDTPLESFRLDEIGTVLLVRKKTDKNQQTITVKPHEWIQIQKSGETSHSRTLPLTHPSLTPGAVVLDKKGIVLLRAYRPSPRLAKAMDFLLPSFPPGSLRPGKRWTEPVQWVEMFGDWKIYWSGELRWTLEGESECGAALCEHLTYQADVKPQLWSGPSWGAGTFRPLRYAGTAHGEVFFDSRHGRLLSNTLFYEGTLRVPITNLGAIPWELRVGRPVSHTPGEILLQFKNKIDIRKN